MQFQKTLLQFNNLTKNFNQKQIFNNIAGSIVESDKIGLIGINGSGKSSLLKILSEKEKQFSGLLQRDAKVEYVPQIDLELYKKEIPVFQYLESTYENWWEIIIQFELLFNAEISETQGLSSLSGGELVKLHIAIAFAKKPQIILLDEPTNHLDLNSLRQLETILKETRIPFVVVSHNVSFINKVANKIWEIDNQKLNIFGGSYDFYKLEKKNILDGKIRKYEDAQKEIKKLQAAKEQEIKRAQRSKQVGLNIAKKQDRSTDRFDTGFSKNKSEKSAGIRKFILENKESDLKEKLSEYKVNSRKNISIKFENNFKKGLIINLENVNLLVNNKIIINKINLQINHSDRIAILGNNGSGKSLLINQLKFNSENSVSENLIGGKVSYGTSYNTVFVNQKYDLVKPILTVLQNIQESNPALSYEDSRRILGSFGFYTEEAISTLAVNLSGGEIARLAFAIATSSNYDLLVLDEPTNNLDIETVEIISQALVEFEGTLIVISHDINFLNNINIKNYFEIENKNLVQKRKENYAV